MKQILEAYVKWKEENPDEPYHCDEIKGFLASQSRDSIYSLFEDLTSPAVKGSDIPATPPKVRYFFISYSHTQGNGFGFGNTIISRNDGRMFNRKMAENMLKTGHDFDSAIILFFKELTESERLEMSPISNNNDRTSHNKNREWL